MSLVHSTSFQGLHDKDHTKLLVDYIFQLTAEEQWRVASSGSGRLTNNRTSRAWKQPAPQAATPKLELGSCEPSDTLGRGGRTYEKQNHV